MQKNKILTLFVGLFVLLAILGLFFLGFKASRLGGFHPGEVYELQALFGDASGLGKEAKVTLAGVQIGRVSSIELIPERAEAKITFEISQSVSLPIDSNARILTSGLLGERYIGITPGTSDKMLKNGDSLTRTGGAMVLEKMLQQISGFSSEFYPDQYYTVKARFSDITGLSSNAAVTQSGVQIGRITNIALDQKTFQAVVTMQIAKQYNQIPLDSSADILSSSLIGGKYIGITAGGDTQMMTDGDEFQYTNSSVVLEKVIQQFITNMSMKN
ncbi:outer membrane lipid asymmetry maintenance protein MlaD [Suttonella ornithocola]|uniref:Probable phospholipid ABC transporter-binding protein mlaD n=1 Tax=Suttonella ornithocola TaxID=279832 RepID=A0A380MWP0_9GAMM|nr:outer membrane lipid asymmetry maintenance protein MlaD [Suttonella ornithocola]SUO96594.1 Probable phospholipid ABC transporter-binding protein mlaD [Suttonella ornithocola]